MVILSNYNLKESKKFFFVLKIFTFIFLICIWNPNNDIYNTVKLFEKKFKRDGTLIMYYNRLLAKHELRKELRTSRLRENSIDDSINRKMKNNPDDISTYGNIKQVKMNDLDAYKKGYKSRHSKKKGLRKLECYCEKKVFDKIDYIYNTAKNTNSTRLFTKKIFNKFAFRFIIFVSIPLLSTIIPLFFGAHSVITKNWCFSSCTLKHDSTSDHEFSKAIENHAKNNRFLTSMDKDTWNIINDVNAVFLCISSVILIFVAIYILLKFIKYEKLKSCKNKMSFRENYQFCKSLFL